MAKFRYDKFGNIIGYSLNELEVGERVWVQPDLSLFTDDRPIFHRKMPMGRVRVVISKSPITGQLEKTIRPTICQRLKSWWTNYREVRD